MSNATRYLCAAAYLAPSFANTVISELVGSHRAVAPSRGIDLEPIIRHCLKARRMQLTRDILLSILLLAGVVVATSGLFAGAVGATVPVILVLVAFFLDYLPGANWERRSVGRGALAGVMAIGGVAVAAALAWPIIASLFLAYLIVQVVKYAGPPGISLHIPSPAGSSLMIAWWLLYVGLIAATLIRYSYVRDWTLCEWLSPGAKAPPFARLAESVENRIAEVNAAQHGNLTLYDGENPFISAGITPFTLCREEERVWSIAIELNREGAPRGLFGSGSCGQVYIDPVELHHVLQKRLLQLNDHRLPASQRVAALTVDHHIVGEGQFRWDSPLIDPERRIPYSQASPEAIRALIRNPQARLRYYQRVSVSDEGQTVLSRERPVIDSADQEIVVSAFVYVAVEGHMFYLQFVPASLAPICDDFRRIDRLPRITSGMFLAKVVMDAVSTAFRDVLRAPASVAATWQQIRKEQRSFAQELTHADDYVYADIGARISVRELAARALPRTYIQRLDTNKYTQVIERLVIDTVLDFLVAKGVDTSAYRASAQAIYNNGVIVAGNNNAVASSTGGGSATATASR